MADNQLLKSGSEVVKEAPDTARTSPRVRRRLTNPVPMEGDNGLYSQSWFPLCLSTDVKIGERIGRDFLGGRVVIFRGDNGKPRVFSAYCPHVGADLSVGFVVGNNIQCAFHKWEFDQDGWAAKTGVGDAVPKSACLFSFPVIERYGLIWAFNGEEPLFDMIEFEYPDDELEYSAFEIGVYNCDGWVFAANTPDMQHTKAVHMLKFLHPDPHDQIQWEQYGFRMKLEAIHQLGEEIKWNAGIRGTSIFMQEGLVNDWWMGVVSGFSCPRPGEHVVFTTVLVKKSDGTAEGDRLTKEHLDYGVWLLSRTAEEDKDILNSIHYMPGALTKGDKSLARYLEMMRNFPRANPAKDFLN